MSPGAIAAIVIAVVVLFTIIRMVRIVPQARAAVVERLGRYVRTQGPGLTLLLPFVDRMRPMIDLREQVVSFPPQPVITSDNLTVGVDSVIYFQVTDPRAATYEIQNYIQAVEQLTITTLRNVIGSRRPGRGASGSQGSRSRRSTRRRPSRTRWRSRCAPIATSGRSS